MSKAGKDKKASSKVEKKWDNAIAKANGMMIKVPDEFLEKARKFNNIHDKLEEEQEKMNDKNAEFKHANENFWYELLRKLKDSGVKPPENIGNAEIGLNKEAAKEGIFIINFTPAAQGGRGPMVM